VVGCQCLFFKKPSLELLPLEESPVGVVDLVKHGSWLGYIPRNYTPSNDEPAAHPADKKYGRVAWESLEALKAQVVPFRRGSVER
jgi:hypothetical protein